MIRLQSPKSPKLEVGNSFEKSGKRFLLGVKRPSLFHVRLVWSKTLLSSNQYHNQMYKLEQYRFEFPLMKERMR